FCSTVNGSLEACPPLIILFPLLGLVRRRGGGVRFGLDENHVGVDARLHFGVVRLGLRVGRIVCFLIRSFLLGVCGRGIGSFLVGLGGLLGGGLLRLLLGSGVSQA